MRTRISRAGFHAEQQSGFTLILVLVALVIIGIAAEGAVALSSHAAQRAREKELLFRGLAYRAAIQSYYEAGQARQDYPRSLEDLIQDPRFVLKRHLRSLYPDPMGKGEWTLVPAPDGGIAGVASSIKQKPIKRSLFPDGLESFEQAETYADWQFVFVPQTAVTNSPRASEQQPENGDSTNGGARHSQTR